MCGIKWTVKMVNMIKNRMSLNSSLISSNAFSVVLSPSPNILDTWHGCYALFLSFPFSLQAFLKVPMAQQRDLIRFMGHNGCKVHKMLMPEMFQTSSKMIQSTRKLRMLPGVTLKIWRHLQLSFRTGLQFVTLLG